jgi:hypothetical protein
MFSGLMFPILEHPDWPPADTSLSLAMLLADSDDDEGGMYARPGMTAEAFVRLAGGGDRRRVAALAMGEGADELHTFAVSVSEHSAYHDASSIDLGGALQTWLPQAVEACAQSDFGDIPQPPGGCQHIDILFVIDGSLSMAAEQDALRGIGGPPVFADFTDALALELDTLEDFRVAVVSSEPGDHLLHTHRDQPAVTPSPETDCGLPKGAPWIVGPSATLEQDFACLAATRASSTSEITAANAGLALADPLNAGFVREDAVLFVVMITDEDTQDAAYDFERIEIRQHILDAVGGDLARVVVLGIAGDQGVFEMPKTTCSGPYGTASPGRRLSSIVHSMREQGIMQDICGGGLAEAFGQALDDLVDTCNDFHPEG